MDNNLVDFKGLLKVFLGVSVVGLVVFGGVWFKEQLRSSRQASVYVVKNKPTNQAARQKQAAEKLVRQKVTALAIVPGGAGSWLIGTEDGLYIKRWEGQVVKAPFYPEKTGEKVKVEKIKVLGEERMACIIPNSFRSSLIQVLEKNKIEILSLK